MRGLSLFVLQGLILICISGQATGSDQTGSLSVACPGAAAWNRSHEDRSLEAAAVRDKNRTFSDPKLREQLQERVERDQSLRRAYRAAPLDETLLRKIQGIDAENLSWLKRQVRDQGIPTVAQAGESGLIQTWLLVQHADRDRTFQAEMLPIFTKRYQSGELDAEYVAKLADRLLLAAGKQQMYGTQFDWLSHEFKPRNPGDTLDIETHRASLGLMPWADYACMMNVTLKNGKGTDSQP
jgi:hypothetical protein